LKKNVFWNLIMNISAGLVGLPNVGKSTLFNALTKAGVPAENYPFCTIDPHIACTEVPDARTEKLQQIYNSKKIINSTVQFVDIAGLVKGAASGEGLGNQFLSHIREVDLILHVLRCFEDPNISYTSGETIDPIADFEVISTELMLKDLDTVKKRKSKVEQLIKASQNKPAQLKEYTQELFILNDLEQALNSTDNDKVRQIFKTNKISTFSLLSAKNFLIIANVGESEIGNHAYEDNEYYKSLIKHFGSEKVIAVSAKLESELVQLTPEEQDEIANMLDLKERGLNTIIKKTYTNLGLITFFTCGPQEIHAWPIIKGTNIREAGGEIHSDLEKGFICAEVFNYSDLIAARTLAKLKDLGKIRTEGQDYIVQDGDIILIKFNV
jgi:ribosome-binding ATPase